MKDAWLHSLAALLLCAGFVWATTPWVFMAMANGLFWLGREQAQSSKLPNRWSRHKHIEWLLPTAVGIISSYATNIFI